MFECLPFDRHAVAARLRELLAARPGENDLRLDAVRLGIPEPTLRLSIDDRSPHPGFETIAAMVRVYGVDPHWLVTGEYDARVHRAAMEIAEKGSAEELEKLLRRELTSLTSSQEPPRDDEQVEIRRSNEVDESPKGPDAVTIAAICPGASLDAARISA